jgi:hypothetical protein
MSFAEKFEDLKIWQEARELANAVYDSMHACRGFVFRSQISLVQAGISRRGAEGGRLLQRIRQLPERPGLQRWKRKAE